jgi:hypothetical protein
MKRTAVLASGILAIFLGLASAASAAPQAPPPSDDSVLLAGAPASTVFTTFPVFRIDEVNVTSGPNGENPIGQVAFQVFIRGIVIEIDGPVTCLAVRGNTATMNVEDQVTFAGSIITVEVVDDQPDTFGASDLGRTPSGCSPAVIDAGFRQALANGDIAVVDAQSPPASKDDCRDRGWEPFGFANQGQCIAFVNRGRAAGGASHG